MRAAHALRLVPVCIQRGKPVADDQLHQLARLHGVRRHRARVPSVSENGDAIADLPGLAEVVRDEQHADALGRDRAHEREEPLALGTGEVCRRLIEHEHPTLRPLVLADNGHSRERSHGRKLRALGGTQVVDRHPRVEIDAEARERLARLAALVLPGDVAAPAPGELLEPQVLDDAERGDQGQVLVDEAEPQLAGLARSQGKPRGPIADRQRAAWIRSVVAGQDLDQRRLARAVFAEQAVNLRA